MLEGRAGGPRQAGRMGHQEPHKIQGQIKNAAPGKQELLAVTQREGWGLGSSSAEKPLWLRQTASRARASSALAARRASSLLGCINRSRASTARDGIQFWSVQCRQDIVKQEEGSKVEQTPSGLHLTKFQKEPAGNLHYVAGQSAPGVIPLLRLTYSSIPYSLLCSESVRPRD